MPPAADAALRLVGAAVSAAVRPGATTFFPMYRRPRLDLVRIQFRRVGAGAGGYLVWAPARVDTT